jgi:hypothetical protein
VTSCIEASRISGARKVVSRISARLTPSTRRRTRADRRDPGRSLGELQAAVGEVSNRTSSATDATNAAIELTRPDDPGRPLVGVEERERERPEERQRERERDEPHRLPHLDQDDGDQRERRRPRRPAT